MPPSYEAAIHEAAHAVVAVMSDWVLLAAPVQITDDGHGQAPAILDHQKLSEAMKKDTNFDTDFPRIELISVFLAGATAERRLVALGQSTITEDKIMRASSNDYEQAREQLSKLTSLPPNGMEFFEGQIRTNLEHPVIWCAVEKFASILLDKRIIQPEDATLTIDEIGDQCDVN